MAGKTCTCGVNFRDPEDWQDHMPCPGSKLEQSEQRVLEIEAELKSDLEDAERRATTWRALALDTTHKECRAHLEAVRDKLAEFTGRLLILCEHDEAAGWDDLIKLAVEMKKYVNPNAMTTEDAILLALKDGPSRVTGLVDLLKDRFDVPKAIRNLERAGKIDIGLDMRVSLPKSKEG